MEDLRKYEKELINDGISLIAGVDEAGRGPLAGPVVAAAVILPNDFILDGLIDSKQLSEKQRNTFFGIINEKALGIGVGVVSPATIDKINIYQASKVAMIEAINGLDLVPDHILVDAMPLDIDIPSTSIIKGDALSISIAAASVIAKVIRDNIMFDYDKLYPVYNFKNNKGYPTKEHIKAIDKHGITNIHRKTYGPVKDYLETIKN